MIKFSWRPYNSFINTNIWFSSVSVKFDLLILSIYPGGPHHFDGFMRWSLIFRPFFLLPFHIIPQLSYYFFSLGFTISRLCVKAFHVKLSRHFGVHKMLVVRLRQKRRELARKLVSNSENKKTKAVEIRALNASGSWGLRVSITHWSPTDAHATETLIKMP